MGQTKYQGAVDGDANILDIHSVQIPDESEICDAVCGSLDEWLHPLPSSEDLGVNMHFFIFHVSR